MHTLMQDVLKVLSACLTNVCALASRELVYVYKPLIHTSEAAKPMYLEMATKEEYELLCTKFTTAGKRDLWTEDGRLSG